MFVVGIIMLVGSVKYIMLSFNAQRGVVQAVAFGSIGFLIGTALCVWAIVGCPD
jgi:hypothetical protein